MEITFEGLVKRIAPKLKGIAYKLGRFRSFYNQDDLYQEALMHLWEEFRVGSLSDKTDSYILQGCFFHLKNYIRKVRSRVELVSLQSLLHEEMEWPVEDTTLMQDESSLYFRDTLHNKLLAETIQNNGFTKREKDMFSLFSQDLTLREIGSRMGVSHVMVLKMMSQVRQKARKYQDSQAM